MDIASVSPRRFTGTMLWALCLSALVITIVSGLARAGMNMQSALIEKPDIAVFILLKEELSAEDTVTDMPLLMHEETLPNGDQQMEYYVETTTGPKHVTLRKEEAEWYLYSVDWLREAP